MLLLTIAQILSVLINVLVMLVIVQFVIGLLFAFNVLGRSNQFFVAVYDSINALLEPLLRPIRRLLPATGAMDFSPLVLIIGLTILEIIVNNMAVATL
ncbi:MAG TPA: YggT family protein [Croceibacterium sp.]|nr:YggT family protein [Croceibacterium sp.]